MRLYLGGVEIFFGGVKKYWGGGWGLRNFQGVCEIFRGVKKYSTGLRIIHWLRQIVKVVVKFSGGVKKFSGRVEIFLGGIGG